MYIALTLVFSVVELLFFYLIEKDILNPSFVFCAVFIVAEVNLMTNISSIGISINSTTMLVIIIGILIFSLGALSAPNIKVPDCKIIGLKRENGKYEFALEKYKLWLILLFNIVSIIFIVHEVYSITVFHGFIGSVYASLGKYAELSKFSGLDVKLSLASTLFTAISEALGYILGYIITYKLVKKEKIGVLLWMAFLTAFLTTFCQGSRGGLFILLSSAIEYILLWRKDRQQKHISVKLILIAICVVLISFIVFQAAGALTNKAWNISVYEYISVYLGFPIKNLDIALQHGIERVPVTGQSSFGGLILRIYRYIGKTLPSYNALKVFQIYNGHNLGNVYTIFAPLIADFGYWGMEIALFIIGFISKLVYSWAKKTRQLIAMSRILYAYLLTSIAFSFFSNKVCENINMYHVYMFIFGWMISIFLTKRIKNEEIKN